MHRVFNRFWWLIIIAAIISAPVFGQKGKSTNKKVLPKLSIDKSKVVLADNQPAESGVSKERLVEISTEYGVMVAKLYDSTPRHRDNFVKLVEQKFYDSLLFHRIINQFMIQGGDPTSKVAADSVRLGSGTGPGNKIPAEFKPFLFHKKGALAAARDGNPEKASSNCQFYIVQGKVYSPDDLDKIYNARVKDANPFFTYTKAQKEIYKRIGGTPFLDQNYTVFGEVISGLDVLDKIAQLPKDEADRPLKNVRMKIKMLN